MWPSLQLSEERREEEESGEAESRTPARVLPPRSTGTRKGAPRDRSGLKVTAGASCPVSGVEEAALVTRMIQRLLQPRQHSGSRECKQMHAHANGTPRLPLHTHTHSFAVCW